MADDPSYPPTYRGIFSQHTPVRYNGHVARKCVVGWHSSALLFREIEPSSCWQEAHMMDGGTAQIWIVHPRAHHGIDMVQSSTIGTRKI